MKSIFLTIAAAMLGFMATAQTSNGSMSNLQIPSKHQERMEKREVRNNNYIRATDSLVLSRNFKFVPSSFQQQPSGTLHVIPSALYYLIVSSDNVDIDMPYISGVVPPYRLVLMNYVTQDVRNYTSEQTSDGWVISFTSSLYSVNQYTFTFTVYSVTREATLNVASDLYNTVTYNGSLEGTY